MNSVLILAALISMLNGCSAKLQKAKALDCKFRLTTQARLLAGKKWTEISIEAMRQEGENAFQNITSQFMPSDLDDVMYFNLNGTYIFDEGKTKARPQSAQVYENDRWCICQSGDLLILGTGPSATQYEIVKLEESLLVLQLLRVRDEKSESYLLTYKVTD